MKNLYFFCWICLFAGILSCSSDDDLNPQCYQDSNRQIIAVFTNVQGEVVGPDPTGCPTIYTLNGGPEVEGRSPVGLLSPCNFPQEMKQDGLEVVYSGYLFETFETEDICAQFFELTDIRIR